MSTFLFSFFIVLIKLKLSGLTFVSFLGLIINLDHTWEGEHRLGNSLLGCHHEPILFIIEMTLETSQHHISGGILERYHADLLHEFIFLQDRI